MVSPAKEPSESNQSDQTAALRAGDQLRQKREELGYSLDEATYGTKIRAEYLSALEDMNTKALPAIAFATGYVRTYAKYLKLDADAMCEQYRAECGHLSAYLAQKEQARLQQEEAARRMPYKAMGLVAASFLVMALAAGGYFYLRPTNPVENPIIVADASAALTEAENDTVSDIVHIGPNQIDIMALETAFLEMRGADGTVYISRQLEAGEVYSPRAEAGWVAYSEQAQNFEVYVNGEAVGPLGNSQDAVYAWRIDQVLDRLK